MKTVSNAKQIAADARQSVAAFKPATLQKIEAMISPYITDDALAVVNDALSDAKVAKLDIPTIAKVAYVHARSISENQGFSPVERIVKYLDKNGIQLNKVGIRTATELLLDIGFIVRLQAEDRKAKRCRQYSLGLGISLT